jgi:HSP20 family protein
MASWSVFNELENFRRELDEAFRGAGAPRPLATAFLAPSSGRRFPMLNLSEDDERVYIDVLVPGCDPRELQLTMLRGALTISGERKPPTEKGFIHRSELGYGKFSRTVDLPTDINVDNTTAEYKDGVMRISMTKSEHAKPRKIEIKAS